MSFLIFLFIRDFENYINIVKSNNLNLRSFDWFDLCNQSAYSFNKHSFHSRYLQVTFSINLLLCSKIEILKSKKKFKKTSQVPAQKQQQQQPQQQ